MNKDPSVSEARFAAWYRGMFGVDPDPESSITTAVRIAYMGGWNDGLREAVKIVEELGPPPVRITCTEIRVG